MKITFNFQNGTSRVFLEPETARDEIYIKLCKESHDEVIIVPGPDRVLALEFRDRKLES